MFVRKRHGRLRVRPRPDWVTANHLEPRYVKVNKGKRWSMLGARGERDCFFGHGTRPVDLAERPYRETRAVAPISRAKRKANSRSRSGLLSATASSR